MTSMAVLDPSRVTTITPRAGPTEYESSTDIESSDIPAWRSCSGSSTASACRMSENTGSDSEPPTKAAGTNHSYESLDATTQKIACEIVVMIKTVRAPRRSTR